MFLSNDFGGPIFTDRFVDDSCDLQHEVLCRRELQDNPEPPAFASSPTLTPTEDTSGGNGNRNDYYKQSSLSVGEYGAGTGVLLLLVLVAIIFLVRKQNELKMTNNMVYHS